MLLDVGIVWLLVYCLDSYLWFWCSICVLGFYCWRMWMLEFVCDFFVICFVFFFCGFLRLLCEVYCGCFVSLKCNCSSLFIILFVFGFCFMWFFVVVMGIYFFLSIGVFCDRYVFCWCWFNFFVIGLSYICCVILISGWYVDFFFVDVLVFLLWLFVCICLWCGLCIFCV